MLFTTPFTLLLALAPTAIFAAPTSTSSTVNSLLGKRSLSASTIKALTDGNCDLSSVTLPVAPTPLPPVTAGLTLKHVAVGRGTQNYTCQSSSPTEVPVAIGANATLFNATCASVRSPTVLSEAPATALRYAVPTSSEADALLSGHHFFLNTTTAFFTLSPGGNLLGTVHAKKIATSSAPAGSAAGSNDMGAVAWLKLSGWEGDFKEIYRVDTAGGSPPKTCDGVTGPIYVDYAAVYYFYA